LHGQGWRQLPQVSPVWAGAAGGTAGIALRVSSVKQCSGTLMNVLGVLKIAYRTFIIPVGFDQPMNFPRVYLVFPVTKSL
jgi:hypothetical protein